MYGWTLNILDTTINFEKPAYSIDENDGAIHPVLTLSNPVSKDMTVKVLSSDGSANGEYMSLLKNNLFT